MNSEQTENLRDMVESHKKERENSRKMAISMLLMVGGNVLTPEPIAKPVIDAANQDEDAFADMVITMEKIDPRSRVAILKAMIVKYLKQRELMELTSDLNELNTDVLAYCAEHEEARKPQMEAIEEFAHFMSEEMDF